MNSIILATDFVDIGNEVSRGSEMFTFIELVGPRDDFAERVFCDEVSRGHTIISLIQVVGPRDDFAERVF